MVVRTALVKGEAHGPPVGFGVIVGFEDNPMPPWLIEELFSVNEHDDDDDADDVGDANEKDALMLAVISEALLFMLMLNGDESE